MHWSGYVHEVSVLEIWEIRGIGLAGRGIGQLVYRGKHGVDVLVSRWVW